MKEVLGLALLQSHRRHDQGKAKAIAVIEAAVPWLMQTIKMRKQGNICNLACGPSSKKTQPQL